MEKIGFYAKEINRDLYPNNPNDLKSNWLVIAPSIDDSLECVEINNKYLLSFGVHAPHIFLLLSRNENLDYLKILKIANTLSFLFDSLVYFVPNEEKVIKKHFKDLKSYFKLKGMHFNEAINIEQSIAEKYEIIDDLIGDYYIRVISNKQGPFGLDMHHDDKLERAIMAYRQGLISFEPYGQILNYWRVLEAITTKNERIDLFKNYNNINLNPVYAYQSYNPHGSRKIINLISIYKKYIRSYYKKLINIHGNSDNLATFFYKFRRCSTAHSKHDVLQETKDVTLASLFKDSLLLKIIARCAIEKYWKDMIK